MLQLLYNVLFLTVLTTVSIKKDNNNLNQLPKFKLNYTYKKFENYSIRI